MEKVEKYNYILGQEITLLSRKFVVTNIINDLNYGIVAHCLYESKAGCFFTQPIDVKVVQKLVPEKYKDNVAKISLVPKKL